MTAKTSDPAAMRMSAREFDRIMRKALQVKPEGGKKKPKGRKKRKTG